MADPQADTHKAQGFATQESRLDMRSMALIGIMGSEAVPRALVRFPNGRIEEVAVGDTLRGNRVDAIGAQRLILSRNGRESVLEMPQG